MASCPKCGKAKVRRRPDGTRRCRTCGTLPGISRRDRSGFPSIGLALAVEETLAVLDGFPRDVEAGAKFLTEAYGVSDADRGPSAQEVVPVVASSRPALVGGEGLGFQSLAKRKRAERLMRGI